MSLLATEPRPTRLDLTFPAWGIPVRVHPSFWLVPVLGLWYSGGALRSALLATLITFLAACAHELGHAGMAVWRGYRSRVTLAWFGGIAVTQVRIDDRASTLAIIAAGPVANLVVALLSLAAAWLLRSLFGLTLAGCYTIASPASWLAAFLLVQGCFNLALCLMNLVPIYGTDGGQLTRAYFCRHVPNGLMRYLWLSTSIAALIFGFAWIKGADVLTRAFLLLLCFNSAYQLSRARSGHFIP